MNLQQQWCDNSTCPDYQKLNQGNIQVHSYAQRRYYCRTCRRTFGFDKGTFFEGLRTNRQKLIDAVSMLVERSSLRAVGRVKLSKPNTVLHWLDLAGQHAAAVSNLLIRDVHVDQVQIDELYTFVKKREFPHAI